MDYIIIPKGNTKDWKQTPYQFVKFILIIAVMRQISSNMNKENLNKLQMAYKIMNSTENNKEYSYKIIKFSKELILIKQDDIYII